MIDMMDMLTTWLAISMSATWFAIIYMFAAWYMVIDVSTAPFQITIIGSRRRIARVAFNTRVVWLWRIF
jgi:hypothetical protein